MRKTQNFYDLIGGADAVIEDEISVLCLEMMGWEKVSTMAD
jgi:hypothetical protein